MYTLSNIQAAFGVAQLENLDEFIKIKEKVHDKYKEQIKRIHGLEVLEVPKYSKNNYWLNILRINENYPMGRDEILKVLEKKSIYARPVWHLNHLQKPYKHNQSYKIENAITLIKNSICLPSSVSSLPEIERIVSYLNI